MRPVAVTLGVFDGVHRGHREVVARGRALADRAACPLVAFTFDPPPRAVLQGEPPALALASLGERVARLRAAGAHEVRVLRFTANLADKEPERFLAEHVFPFGPLALLAVGYDFAMGRGRRGTIEALRRIGAGRGFAVHAVPPVLDGGEPVSSSRIRGALAAGDVAAAARLLGRPYRLSGPVVQGDARGRALGFPTANMDVPASRLRPAAGVYAVRAHGAGPGPHDGVANLGVRPTFGGGRETVEVHLLDVDRDLVGLPLALDFVGRLRSEVKFKGPQELRAQIARDVRAARTLLTEESLAPETP